MTGTVCGLCHQSRTVVDSHLIPASIYKLLRDENEANPNPIVIAGLKATTSSKQVQKPFLCRDCEDRLSRQGEIEIAPNCARLDSFPLREKLKQVKPLVSNGLAAFDLRAVFGERASAFIYFPVSVFWRASATLWPDHGRPTRYMSLGKYEEPVRRYLLGEAELPKEVVIVMAIASDNIPQVVTFPASVTREGRCKWHQFVIPGIIYSALVGKVTAAERDVRMNHASATVALAGPLREAKIYQNIFEMGRSISLSRSLKARYGIE